MNEIYLKRCIELAYKGLGTSCPNPLVGSVIVHHDEIIGEGWHKKAGEPHAEVNAINSVKNKYLLPFSTIYVSLEPCAHFGKTPPCADLIIQHKIPKVVIGIQDPFAKVNGLGIKKLRDAGIEVIMSSLTKECWELNKRFFTFHEQKRPYIILKWAETQDGFIDRERTNTQPHQNWITNAFSKQLVHKWRSEEAAILVGKNTVLNDNPSLDVREWAGNQPTRIIIDPNLEIPNDYSIYNQKIRTIILNKKHTEQQENLQFIQIDFENMVQEICRVLYEQQLQSLIVEGGQNTLQQFINQDLWDEARIFTGNISFEKGLKAPEIDGIFVEEQKIKNDSLKIIRNKKWIPILP